MSEPMGFVFFAGDGTWGAGVGVVAVGGTGLKG